MSSGLLGLVALAMVAGARQPQHEVLATATTQPGAPGVTTPATVPVDPVQLPTPTGRETRAPASVSATPIQLGLASVGSIPDTALSAYQRAAAVIDAADPTCHLDWTLLAAIGQVESDQGQVNGSHLDTQGVATPAILGPRLDGRQGMSSISDTDAGKLDGDRHFDRAVGPMQFLPSTWAAVAVDGDNDGRRDPQDIDDAALGSAVYLCADDNDLATGAGAKAAVYRYNHSDAYVARVLAIARSLRASGEFTSITTGTTTVTPPGTLPGTLPGVTDDPTVVGHPGHHGPLTTPPLHGWADPPGPVIHDPGPPSDPTDPPTTDPPSDPTDPPTTDPPSNPTPPTDPPSNPTPPTDPPSDPTPPTDPPTTDPAEPPILTDPLPTELADLTAAQVDAYNAAWAACDDDLTAGWSGDTVTRDALTQCLADALVVPVDDAQLLTFVSWVARTEDGATQ